MLLRRLGALGWGFALVASACSGASDDSVLDSVGDRTEATTGADVTTAGTRPFIADALGALAVDRGEPAVATFGSQASSFDFDDGGVIEVPSGAFEADTDVTISSFDLSFDQFVTPSPTASLHVFATVDDVELAAPLTVTLPSQDIDVTVLQSRDDEWSRRDVAAGAPIAIEIDHFSEVAVAVVGNIDAASAAIEGLPDGDAPADFLRACVFAVVNIYAPDTDDQEQVNFAADLAFSICTTALVRRSSPEGSNVSVACVGDKIGGDVDLQGAIDACIAEQDDPTDLATVAPGESVATPVTAETEGSSGYRTVLADAFCPDDAAVISATPLTIIFAPDGTFSGSGGAVTCDLGDGDQLTTTFSAAGSWNTATGELEGAVEVVTGGSPANVPISGTMDFVALTITLAGNLGTNTYSIEPL